MSLLIEMIVAGIVTCLVVALLMAVVSVVNGVNLFNLDD